MCKYTGCLIATYTADGLLSPDIQKDFLGHLQGFRIVDFGFKYLISINIYPLSYRYLAQTQKLFFKKLLITRTGDHVDS